VIKRARAVSQSDFVQNVIRDLKSLKAFWAHAYLLLYAWVCVRAVLHHPEAIQTVVAVTGGVVSAVFGGYVFSRRSNPSSGEPVQSTNRSTPPSSEEQAGD